MPALLTVEPASSWPSLLPRNSPSIWHSLPPLKPGSCWPSLLPLKPGSCWPSLLPLKPGSCWPSLLPLKPEVENLHCFRLNLLDDYLDYQLAETQHLSLTKVLRPVQKIGRASCRERV